MILSKDQEKEFEDLTRPVMQWLNNNCHPHVNVTICATRAELSEGVAGFTTFDYLVDKECDRKIIEHEEELEFEKIADI